MSNDDIELAVDTLIEAVKTPEGIEVFAESLVNTYLVDDEEMFKGEMRIKEILRQSRRDFTAVYECESCGNSIEGSGYDDSYFHENVIPKMKCKSCGEVSKDYQPLATKYQDWEVV